MAVIRKATQEDAGAISHVHVESWRSTYRGIVPDEYLASLNAGKRAAQWREILNSGRLTLVAEEAGKVVGFIGGGAIREPLGDCDAELYAFYLLLQAQRKGIGTALLTELAKRLDQEGFRSMAVWVLEGNSAALFYQRWGAVRVGAKEVEIGGVMLPETAYAWPGLEILL